MDAASLTRALGGAWREGMGSAPCPAPGHGRGRGDRNWSLSIRGGSSQQIVLHCHAGCSQVAVIAELRSLGLWRALDVAVQGEGRHARVPNRTPEPDPDRNRNVARSLWRRSEPLAGTPADHYLRTGRGIHCTLPPSLRYLTASGAHPHAMIASFGLVKECEPAVLSTPTSATAVHLTRLSQDGLTRLDKRMIGAVSGLPIVLAPPNDGLGLVITEGIEDALSLHAATGLGAWAGGSAAHMAKLAEAVPDYIECVTIAEDNNEAGQRATAQLAAALAARGMDVHIFRAWA